MPSRAIPLLKAVVHLLCLVPFAWLLHFYTSGALAQSSDPIQYVTHFTGNWALWLLTADLAITPLRRLHPSLSLLIRFRRMVGLYAFFYATLHLATYVFLFSGYDVPTALAGLRSGHPLEVWTQLKLAWPAMWDDIRERRFIVMGFSAWVILLALAVTSPLAVLRAMGGKNWQRLHRLIYLAGFLVLVHYWWQIKKGMPTPWKVTVIIYALFVARIVYFAMKKFKSRRNLPA